MFVNSTEDKKSAEERVGDLEKQVKYLQTQLSTQQSESKKALADAQDATTCRDKELASRLLGLARSAKGECTIFASSFFGYFSSFCS